MQETATKHHFYSFHAKVYKHLHNFRGTCPVLYELAIHSLWISTVQRCSIEEGRKNYPANFIHSTQSNSNLSWKREINLLLCALVLDDRTNQTDQSVTNISQSLKTYCKWINWNRNYWIIEITVLHCVR